MASPQREQLSFSGIMRDIQQHCSPPPLPSPTPSSPPPLIDYFAVVQAEIQAQYNVMDSWSSSNEPRHLPRQMLDQPVLPSNVFPAHDSTVESHGLRPLLPAPMTFSASLQADMEQQERQRLQLGRLEQERTVNMRSRSRSASSDTSHHGSNSSESLRSSASSRPRSKNKYFIQTPPDLDLKLMIQKVLKMSDVDSHGRIVIPKKVAEDVLPYLHEKVRMNIPMRDVFTGEIWDIKYRLWPDNGSKLYVFENTGKYIAKYKLTGGDLVAFFEDARWNFYIGCKKLTVPRVSQHQVLVVESEEAKQQRTTKDLVCHSVADDEEFTSEVNEIMKKPVDTMNEVAGDKGQLQTNVQADGAGTSRGVADVNLEISAPQNDIMVIDEPLIDLDYYNADLLEKSYFPFCGGSLEDGLSDFLRE